MLLLLALGAVGCPQPVQTVPTDPRTCPAAPGPGPGSACSTAGASCWYTGTAGCGLHCSCDGQRWSCGESGRFACGRCASDVHCASGTEPACMSETGGTCACGSDGVFGCVASVDAGADGSADGGDGAADGGAPDLPACPVTEPAQSTPCPAPLQECDYWPTSQPCVDACVCGADGWECREECGG